MYDMKPERANDILQYARHRELMGDDPIYIICGKSGPTGKTWIWNELKKRGYNAIEISEGIGGFVEYPDNKNHMRAGGIGFLGGRPLVIIVLNKPLDEAWKS